MESEPRLDTCSVKTALSHAGKSSKKKKLCLSIQIIAFLLCVFGFALQVTEVLTHFFRYPTVLNLQVKSPEEFFIPAVTVCNVNRIKRSFFCKENPEKCEKPPDMIKFCHHHPHYCVKGMNVSDFMIPTIDAINSTTLDDVDEFGYSFDGFILYEGRHGFEGPFYYPLKLGNDMYPCYTRNARYDSESEAKTTSFSSGFTTMGHLRIDVDPPETFDPREEPGANIVIHSPFVKADPYFKGVFLRLGRTYKFHMKIEEEHLLPSPYQTDCFDYDDAFKKWKSGPRSREICQENCKIDNYLNCYNCIGDPRIYAYSSNPCLENDSRTESWECSDMAEQDVSKCMEECKKECVRIKYTYKIQERTSIKEGEKDYIDVYLFMQDSEVQVLSHKAAILVVELFGYVGGLSGIWLGISIWAIAGYIQEFFNFIMSCSKRDKKF